LHNEGQNGKFLVKKKHMEVEEETIQ